MKLEFTFLIFSIGLLLDTAEAGARGYDKPQFLGYNTASVQRHLKIDFPQYEKLFTWQNVQKFTSDCRQGRNYRWTGDEEITNSYVMNDSTIVKTVSKSCWMLICDYNQWGEYHYDQLQSGSSQETCGYDRYTDEKKKCYGAKGVGIGCR